ncbi:hypothetical protein BH11ARM2_BH11ARM2_30230 [soil metagenome]
MRLQDYLVSVTLGSLDDVCRAALAVPTDKADWSPGGEARSTLDQMREVATGAELFLPLVRGDGMPDFSVHMRTRAGLIDVESCAALARESTSNLCREIAAFPDERLDEEIALPFAGGVRWTMAELLGKHHWNLTYHLGQISQIQLMLGDRAMH